MSLIGLTGRICLTSPGVAKKRRMSTRIYFVEIIAFLYCVPIRTSVYLLKTIGKTEMFETETVILLGAGASMPYDFPSGRTLLFEIARSLNEGILHIKRGGDPDYAPLVYRSIIEHKIARQSIEFFAEDLSKTMQPSIDSFLEMYPEYVEMGKVAIAASLIPHVSLGNITSRNQQDIKWYEYFFNLLGSPHNIVRMKQLSIVTFNYDRSLEYFLFNAFMNSYHLDSTQAIDLMKRIPIIHIYGELGLPTFFSKDGRDYDTKVDIENIKKCVEGIKIMPEIEDSHSALGDVHKVLSEAGKLIVIGFSYHPVNVIRLKLGETYKGKVVGTVKGMEDGEVLRVRKTLYQYSIHEAELHQFDALNFLRKTDYL